MAPSDHPARPVRPPEEKREMSGDKSHQPIMDLKLLLVNVPSQEMDEMGLGQAMENKTVVCTLLQRPVYTTTFWIKSLQPRVDSVPG